MEIIEIEKVFVGGLLLSPDKLADVAGLVSPSDFIGEKSALTYSTMLDLWRDYKTVTADTISQKIDNIRFLADISDVGSVASLKHNARVITGEAKKRRLSLKLSEAVKNIRFGTVDNILTEILNVYNSESETILKDPGAVAIIDRFRDEVKVNRDRGTNGIPTNIDFFQSKYIEFVPGQLWMLGAYTSTGKTAFMVSMLSAIFQNNPNIEIISTEMTANQLVGRFVAHNTGVNANVVRSGNYISKFEEPIQKELSFLFERNFRLHDSLKTIDQIQQVVRKRFLQGGVDVVFIDYIQQLRMPGCRSKYEESSQIAISLQQLAKDCECAIVCLSQITASVHKENSGTVEYKGAGELAEACDIGLWLRRSTEDEKKIMVEIRKNRHGPLGKQVFMYRDGYTRLDPMDSAENK